LFFVAAIYPLITSLPQRHPSDYPDQMMLSIYFTLGIFLLLAVRNPSANRTLIAFTGWSSLAHAAVMTIQSIQIGSERTELPALGVAAIIAIALIVLNAAKRPSERASAASAYPNSGLPSSHL
jgi:hypothetical protein